MESATKADQVFSVVNMKVLNMNGVKDVAECDGTRIILDTLHGRMTVEGEELKIESSVGQSVYVICYVIVATIVVGAILGFIKKKKREALYD